MAVTAVTAYAAAGPAAAAGRLSTTPVVINCAGHSQVRPRSYILACADGNAYLHRLSWATWGSASAFGAGTDTFNVCIPSCTAGHLHSYPVLVALWRVKPLPGHPGERYFTRLTTIDTGSLTYRVGGKTYHLPRTVTYPLFPSGGA